MIMKKPTPMHSGEISGKKKKKNIIIIGYNILNRTCLVCFINKIPEPEKQRILDIAHANQSSFYLVPALRQGNVFEFISSIYQNAFDNRVTNYYLSDIESMNEEQRNFFQTETDSSKRRVNEQIKRDEMKDTLTTGT